MLNKSVVVIVLNVVVVIVMVIVDPRRLPVLRKISNPHMKVEEPSLVKVVVVDSEVDVEEEDSVEVVVDPEVLPVVLLKNNTKHIKNYIKKMESQFVILTTVFLQELKKNL